MIMSTIFHFSTQWEKMQQQHEDDEPMTPSHAPSTQLVNRAPIELPFYGKYLLIAAYLASYNPAKCDKRFFVMVCSNIIYIGK